MSDSAFFIQIENQSNKSGVIDILQSWSSKSNKQMYVIDRPLGEIKYIYKHDAIVILIPGMKIAFVDFSNDNVAFDEYCLDFIEDLGSISDKYEYREAIGRPREWQKDLIKKFSSSELSNINDFIKKISISDPAKVKISELLISLLTGSINEINRVTAEMPNNLLDKVKRKIVLFDGDQTRFIYKPHPGQKLSIQGLSGTGKTELLLHKLKDISISEPNVKIMFTCHNKILADSLKKRIPTFFNFMKVQQQIEWDEKLWCVHAWGSRLIKNSGLFKIISDYYGIDFISFGNTGGYERASKLYLAELMDLKQKQQFTHAFDYLFIDESQDFTPSFFELCSFITKNKIFIAGDIFQSIFDTEKKSTETDYLLNKCYRTDPRTLMFAHALCMGLFEEVKFNWLEKSEWVDCGYIVDDAVKGKYILSREPIRRFEDIKQEGVESIIVNDIPNKINSYVEKTISIIEDIASNNPTFTVDDLGIIFLDSNLNDMYLIAKLIGDLVNEKFGWEINKAYETKRRESNKLFISNQNNVKGLEFPFIICITDKILPHPIYRNQLYMTLTRSFIQSYMLISSEHNQKLIPMINNAINMIESKNHLEVSIPTEEEIKKIRMKIISFIDNKSFHDLIQEVFTELDVMPIFRTNLIDVASKILGNSFDKDKIKKVVISSYEMMQDS